MGVGDTYLTEGAEAEAECNHGSRPSLGESMAAAVVVEHMSTLQLHIHTYTHTCTQGWGEGEMGRGGEEEKSEREIHVSFIPPCRVVIL